MDIPWDNFPKWLEGDLALYWITGKPGSGKSTLMKYLHNDPRIPALLQHWSGELSLTIAGFFFWNSETEVQMSKLGLLQTLLHYAIGNDCKLIPTLFPERWRSYMLLGGSLYHWSMSELLRAFKILISDSSRAFFFLIDGLDEFDGEVPSLRTSSRMPCHREQMSRYVWQADLGSSLRMLSSKCPLFNLNFSQPMTYTSSPPKSCVEIACF